MNINNFNNNNHNNSNINNANTNCLICNTEKFKYRCPECKIK